MKRILRTPAVLAGRIARTRFCPKTVFGLLAILILGVPAESTIISSIEVSFEREIKGPQKTELTKGSLYYWAAPSGKLTLAVRVPIDQLMMLDGKTLQIYYPGTKQAFQIQSQNPFLLPFFQFFLDSSKDDFGLAARGFNFVKYEKKRGDLISHWSPPKEASGFIGTTILTHRGNKITRVETHGPKGEALSEIEYHDHVQIAGAWLPLDLEIRSHDTAGTVLETVRFGRPVINGQIPAEIRDFKMPEGTSIKTVQW